METQGNWSRRPRFKTSPGYKVPRHIMPPRRLASQPARRVSAVWMTVATGIKSDAMFALATHLPNSKEKLTIYKMNFLTKKLQFSI